MRQEMVYEMRKLPDNIPIDQPVPGKAGFEYGIFFKHANTKSYCRY
jgi:hypothetical protein